MAHGSHKQPGKEMNHSLRDSLQHNVEGERSGTRYALYEVHTVKFKHRQNCSVVSEAVVPIPGGGWEGYGLSGDRWVWGVLAYTRIKAHRAAHLQLLHTSGEGKAKLTQWAWITFHQRSGLSSRSSGLGPRTNWDRPLLLMVRVATRTQ